jgi:hypothetical protein
MKDRLFEKDRRDTMTRWMRGALAIMLAVLVGGVAMAAEMTMKFPSIEGKALTGAAFRAPEDFTKDENLVLVAFLREQQKDIDTWIPHLEALADSTAGFAFYEFPVIGKANAVTRFFIYNGMRGGVTSEKARARTVTFYIDKGAFKARLGIVDEGKISLFLVRRDGTIIWQSSGTWSEDKERALREVLGRR